MLRKNVFPLFILLLIGLLTDWYVYQGVKVLTAALAPPGLVHIIPVVWWLISVTVLLAFIYLFYRIFPSRKFTLLFNLVFNSFLTLFVSKLVFIAVLLIGDCYRLAAAAVNLAVRGVFLLPQRPVWLIGTGAVLAVLLLLAFIFGITVGKYYYKVRRTELFFDDLPAAFDGFTITQISDIHAGSFDKPARVQKGIDLINAQGSDLFVFTGDLVNNRAEEIVPYLDMFKQIKAPSGQFAVLGNHDYGDYTAWNSAAEKMQNLQQLKQYHQELGFRLLLDEHVLINKGQDRIALLGVENWGKGFGQRGKLQRALAGVDNAAFKLLLSHDPSHWDEQVKNNPVKIHLTLSGHTHGMQFGIEIGRFRWSPVKYRYPNWAGIATENGRYLYVNRGFGFLGFSGRIGIWPEITVITLKRKPPVT